MGDGPFNKDEISFARCKFIKSLIRHAFGIMLLPAALGVFVLFGSLLHLGLNPLFKVLNISNLNLYVVLGGMGFTLLFAVMILLAALAWFCGGSPGLGEKKAFKNYCLSTLGKLPFTILGLAFLVVLGGVGILLIVGSISAGTALGKMCDPKNP